MSVRNLKQGIVGQGTLRIVAADVLEGLQRRAPGVDQGLLSGEPRIPGELILGLGMRIALGQPELRQRVLAADQLVQVLCSRMFGKEALEAVVGVDVFSLLVLALGDVVHCLLAPLRAFAFLGDLSVGRFGLGELALLEQLLGLVQFLFGLGIGLGLHHRPPAVGAQNQGRVRFRVRVRASESLPLSSETLLPLGFSHRARGFAAARPSQRRMIASLPSRCL